MSISTSLPVDFFLFYRVARCPRKAKQKKALVPVAVLRRQRTGIVWVAAIRLTERPLFLPFLLRAPTGAMQLQPMLFQL